MKWARCQECLSEFAISNEDDAAHWDRCEYCGQSCWEETVTQKEIDQLLEEREKNERKKEKDAYERNS